MQNIVEKINKIKGFLSQNFFEREEIIDGLFVSLVSKENMLMVGPPGAAKSQIARLLFKNCLDGVNYFEKAFTKTTKPEEVVGPMSLKGLEQERYYHVTNGYLPEAHVGLLDEIFKSNSSVLHLMLPLANSGERMFQQEGSEIATPLFSLIGTSNEFIEEDEGLEAFYNRFILRYEVGYLQEAGNFAAMLDLNAIDPAQVPKIGFDELKQLQNTCCQNVTFTELTKENLVKIWHQLIEDGLRPSDRQFRDSTKLVKAMAVLDGRKATEPSDLDILRHSLWEDPEERQQIASIVRKFCTDSVKGKCDSLMTQAKEIYNNAMREQDPDGGIEATKKFKQIGKRLRELKDQNPSKSQMLEEGLKKVQSLNSEVQNICLGV